MANQCTENGLHRETAWQARLAESAQHRERERAHKTGMDAPELVAAEARILAAEAQRRRDRAARHRIAS